MDLSTPLTTDGGGHNPLDDPKDADYQSSESTRLSHVIEMKRKEQEELSNEHKELGVQRDEGKISDNELRTKIDEVNSRNYLVGEELWLHIYKKQKWDGYIDNQQVSRTAEYIHGLYKFTNQRWFLSGKKTKKRESSFRFQYQVQDWYNGMSIRKLTLPPGEGLIANDDFEYMWCQVLGWFAFTGTRRVKATHIVPDLVVASNEGEALFGDYAAHLNHPRNTLFLSNRIASWFQKYHIVITPLEGHEDEEPSRWQVNVMNQSICNWPVRYKPILQRRGTSLEAMTDEEMVANSTLEKPFVGKHLHGRELQFRGLNRPSRTFLFFHHMMALVKRKDLQVRDWKETWDKYYRKTAPFGSPAPYIRSSMLKSLLTYHQMPSPDIVNDWVAKYGFKDKQTSEIMEPHEVREIARRVLLFLEEKYEEEGEKERESGEEDSDDEDASGSEED